MAEQTAADLDFWASERGLLERVALLGDKVQLGVYNLATQLLGYNAGAYGFRISGDLGPNSCQWCILHVGKVYPAGTFMPTLPKHPHCPHYYEPVLSGDKQSLWWLLPWMAHAELEQRRREREAKQRQNSQ